MCSDHALHFPCYMYVYYPVHHVSKYLEVELKVVLMLMWFATPCNFYKNESFLNYDNNHSFKIFKLYYMYICPKNAFIKFHKGNKK